jgi:catechol 2,3-dioxygenase-like lactoylglutathione lyase family enzyme
MLNEDSKIINYSGRPHARAINHVGMSVTDLKKAIEFYTKTFDLKVLKEETINTEGSSMNAKIFKDIFKCRLKKVKAAWLNSSNGVGLEIFEFVDPKAERPADEFENWKKRFSHICITDPNIDELCNKIEQNGGIRHSEFWYPIKGREYKLVYCKDPFGNFIEIFTHGYEQFISGQ